MAKLNQEEVKHLYVLVDNQVASINLGISKLGKIDTETQRNHVEVLRERLDKARKLREKLGNMLD